MEIRERPLFTDQYDSTDMFVPEPGSVFVYAESIEERCFHIESWRSKSIDVKFVKIIDQTGSTFMAEVDFANKRRFSLRSTIQLQEFWTILGSSKTYIDLTGLAHHIWAPLLLERFRHVNM